MTSWLCSVCYQFSFALCCQWSVIPLLVLCFVRWLFDCFMHCCVFVFTGQWTKEEMRRWKEMCLVVIDTSCGVTDACCCKSPPMVNSCLPLWIWFVLLNGMISCYLVITSIILFFPFATVYFLILFLNMQLFVNHVFTYTV